MPAAFSSLKARVLFGLVLFKVAYLALVSTAIYLWPEFDQEQAEGIRERWFALADPTWRPAEGHGFAKHLATWDAEHYLFLSEHGYKAGVPSCAFYPLWPLLVRWCSVLTGGSGVVAGMILANLFSLAGWLVFFDVAAKRFGERAALAALILLIVFPGALFFQFIYSEPLFFLLLMLLWRGLEREEYWLAAAAAFLLPLTRGVGLFCVLPIGWHLLMRQRWSWLDRWEWLRVERGGGRPVELSGGGLDFGQGAANLRAGPALALHALPSGRGRSNRVPPPESAKATGCGESASVAAVPMRLAPDAPHASPELGPRRRPRWSRLALVAALLAGFTLYLLLMRRWTGNAFEGFAAQKFWGAHSIGNLFNVPKFIVGFFNPTDWHDFQGSVLDRCAFLVVLYSIPLLCRAGKDLLVWLYVLAVLPAMSGTFVSFVRFESVAFPVFIALALFFTGLKRRWPLALFVAGSALLQVVLLWRFVNFGWAG